MTGKAKRLAKAVGNAAASLAFGIILWPIAILWHAFLAISFPIRIMLEAKE